MRALRGLLDRLILPTGREVERSRWHRHVVQRRVSRFDQLRPHRLDWETLKRPGPAEPAAAEPDQPLTPRTVAGIRCFWLDGLFTTVSENFYLGFIPLYLLAYGASTTDVGVLTAVQNLLGAVALFPGARLSDSGRTRKGLVVWSVGGVARLALLALALVPWLWAGPRAVIFALIALNGVRSFMTNFGNPAWTALVADLVPRSLRASYFANRNTMMGVAALVVAPLAGWLIRGGNAWAPPAGGYQVAFLLAFASGLVATWCFRAIPEPHRRAVDRTPRERQPGLFRALAASPGFLGLVASAFVWNMALQVAAPFFNVYLVGHLGASVSTVGLLAGVNLFFALVGTWWFGAVIERRGSLWVQQLCGFLIPVLPLSWMVVTAPWQTAFIEAWGGLVWAGYNMANFNLLLEMTPDQRRTEAVALYQTVVFTSAVLGPLLGGWLADTVGFKPVFALSGAGRLCAMGLFVWLAVWPARRALATPRPAA